MDKELRRIREITLKALNDSFESGRIVPPPEWPEKWNRRWQKHGYDALGAHSAHWPEGLWRAPGDYKHGAPYWRIYRRTSDNVRVSFIVDGIERKLTIPYLDAAYAASRAEIPTEATAMIVTWTLAVLGMPSVDWRYL